MATIDDVKRRVTSIKDNLEELSIIKELYEAEQKIKEIQDKIKKARSDIEDIEADDGGMSKPLISSLKSEEKELQIIENKLADHIEYWDKKRREEDLINGKLTGADAIKAQKEMGLQILKEVDNQGMIIDSIGENIKGANANLVNINAELQNQGEQMNRIQEKTHETESQVKQTAKIMTKMEGRAKCVQVITFLAVIIVGLFDICWIVFLLVRKFKK
jgi:hypothetical protein